MLVLRESMPPQAQTSSTTKSHATAASRLFHVQFTNWLQRRNEQHAAITWFQRRQFLAELTVRRVGIFLRCDAHERIDQLGSEAVDLLVRPGPLFNAERHQEI